MSVEARRGCGYRKVGGLYMVSGGLSAPCGRLPIELHVCPVCNAGIKQTRAWQWVKPRQLLADGKPCERGLTWSADCRTCPLSPANLPEKAGLIWIGEKFYPTAREFMLEAHAMGVSRRIPAIPRNFKLGETWVLIGHPLAVERAPRTPEEVEELRESNRVLADAGKPQRLYITRGGILTMFQPVRIEKIVTETQAQDAAAPVAVPDDDKDHQGSAHDKDEEPEPFNPRAFVDERLADTRSGP